MTRRYIQDIQDFYLHDRRSEMFLAFFKQTKKMMQYTHVSTTKAQFISQHI